MRKVSDAGVPASFPRPRLPGPATGPDPGSVVRGSALTVGVAERARGHYGNTSGSRSASCVLTSRAETCEKAVGACARGGRRGVGPWEEPG